jgi:hypothetical protein
MSNHTQSAQFPKKEGHPVRGGLKVVGEDALRGRFITSGQGFSCK